MTAKKQASAGDYTQSGKKPEKRSKGTTPAVKANSNTPRARESSSGMAYSGDPNVAMEMRSMDYPEEDTGGTLSNPSKRNTQSSQSLYSTKGKKTNASSPSKAKAGSKSGQREAMDSPSSSTAKETRKGAKKKELPLPTTSHGKSSAKPSEEELTTALAEVPWDDARKQLEGLPPSFDVLTAKQKLFVIYYAVTRKGVDSARMAGYEGDYNTLAVTSSENLRNPNILKAYDDYMRPEFEKQGVTLERILTNVADMAFAPWGDYVFVREKKGRIVEVRMPLGVKYKSLELLAKMMRLIGHDDDSIKAMIDQSQHLHIHNYKTADEARQALVDYLKKRK